MIASPEIDAVTVAVRVPGHDPPWRRAGSQQIRIPRPVMMVAAYADHEHRCLAAANAAAELLTKAPYFDYNSWADHGRSQFSSLPLHQVRWASFLPEVIKG